MRRALVAVAFRSSWLLARALISRRVLFGRVERPYVTSDFIGVAIVNSKVGAAAWSPAQMSNLCCSAQSRRDCLRSLRASCYAWPEASQHTLTHHTRRASHAHGHAHGLSHSLCGGAQTHASTEAFRRHQLVLGAGLRRAAQRLSLFGCERRTRSACSRRRSCCRS
eukprot:6176787-Pleurochrysis_carterae.AAC.3